MKKKLITKDNSFNIIEVVLIIIVTAVVFSFCTGIVLYNRYGKSSKIFSTNEINDFAEAYETITNNYYKEVNKQEIIDVAINAMYDYLNDPYTSYLDEGTATSLLESLDGSYNGIGVKLKEQDDYIVIKSILTNTPAEKSGLKEGDIIISINNIDVTEYSLTEIENLIKRGEKSNFKIIIKRMNEELSYDLKRELLEMPIVEYEELDNNIGYISISVFGNKTVLQLKDALNNLNTKGINNLIIDLRDNTGGYLNVVKTTSELFLDKGKLIYSLQEKLKVTSIYDETDEHQTGKIIVLTNELTASAAEILTGSLKYSYGATIIGTKTFGKGKVQQTVGLKNGSMIKYTSSKWLLPNNECIDNIGIEPDIEVKRSTYETKDSNGYPIVKYTSVDEQLNRAIIEMTK